MCAGAMERTYDQPERVVKARRPYLLAVTRFPVWTLALISVLVLAGPRPALSQGLPAFAPLNPVASSRSGVYFQPLRDPAPNRWSGSFALDYASVIEYNQLPQANYVLDSEVLRLSFGITHDLSRDMFLTLSGSALGAYAGFLDGFLDWYHGALGIRLSERESRPRDRFLYSVTLPDGRTVARSNSDLFLGDVRVGVGVRVLPRLQSMLSFTLPTSTGPEGYGAGVLSVALLNTFRTLLNPRLTYEGSAGIGYTPTHGALANFQRKSFVALSSGLRYRVWGEQSLFANAFFHSPYYRGTSLPALDRRELSLDFGWLMETRGGGQWRIGLTEDLEPGGPGVDLVLRVGRTF